MDAADIKTPRSVGRNVGWLVGPVVKFVKTEEPDIGEKDSGVHVNPVQFVDVIAAVSFCDIAIRSDQIELSSAGSRIIAWLGARISTYLSQHSPTNIVPMKVSPDAQMLNLEFIRPATFARAYEGMVDGMVIVIDVLCIPSKLAGKKFGVERCIFGGR